MLVVIQILIAVLGRFRGGGEDSDGNHAAGPSCDIVAEHLTAFFPLAEISHEAKFQSNELICLLEEISRQDNLGGCGDLARFTINRKVEQKKKNRENTVW